MKRLVYIFILLLSQSSFLTQESVIDRFELAINEQNVTQISDLCDAFVEVETLNTDRVTSRAQLGAVLKEFFTTKWKKSQYS